MATCEWCGHEYRRKQRHQRFDIQRCRIDAWRAEKMKAVAGKLTIDDVLKRRVAEILSDEFGWPLEPPGREDG